jgi:hypothetical protein
LKGTHNSYEKTKYSSFCFIFSVSISSNRLKQLLYNDEQQYEREIETSIETPLERASRLREKAKKIRDEKELEKKQFIEEKLDQKWRYSKPIEVFENKRSYDKFGYLTQQK